ncbi:MAG: hypothetical protein LBO03_10105 [Acidaminococcales bacterium]|jgi:alpha-tubulin suppressor-like RCC1 family protein|nr:hypothetical protein [Acidaminococcales bacterium]
MRKIALFLAVCFFLAFAGAPAQAASMEIAVRAEGSTESQAIANAKKEGVKKAALSITELSAEQTALIAESYAEYVEDFRVLRKETSAKGILIFGKATVSADKIAQAVKKIVQTARQEEFQETKVKPSVSVFIRVRGGTGGEAAGAERVRQAYVDALRKVGFAVSGGGESELASLFADQSTSFEDFMAKMRERLKEEVAIKIAVFGEIKIESGEDASGAWAKSVVRIEARDLVKDSQLITEFSDNESLRRRTSAEACDLLLEKSARTSASDVTADILNYWQGRLPEEGASVAAPAQGEGNMPRIAAGAFYTLAVKKDGTLWAWGDNETGLLGDGTNVGRNIPGKIMADVVGVAAGAMRSLAVKKDGSLWFLGGVNNLPAKIMEDVAGAANGGLEYVYTLAVKKDGTLWAWEDNEYGESALRSLPIKLMEDVAGAAVGFGHILAVKKDGTLWAWGDNENGQMVEIISYSNNGMMPHNRGIDINRTFPVKLAEGVAGIAAAPDNMLFVKKDGTLWAWSADYRVTGVSGSVVKTIYAPIKITEGIDGVSGVAATNSHILAVKKDGTLWVWEGEKLFVGANAAKLSPAKVADGVAGVAAGYDHMLFVKKDGTLWAWGKNGSGQLGDGTNVGKAAPVKVMEGL